MTPISKKPSKEELLKLPFKASSWSDENIYDYIYLVPTGKKYDSGYAMIAIIGVIYGEKDEPATAEIAAYCDDVCWSFPITHPYDRIERGIHKMIMRTDCEYPSRIFRMWASGEHYFRGRFKVGASLSSTDVTLVVEKVASPQIAPAP